MKTELVDLRPGPVRVTDPGGPAAGAPRIAPADARKGWKIVVEEGTDRAVVTFFARALRGRYRWEQRVGVVTCLYEAELRDLDPHQRLVRYLEALAATLRA